MEEEWRYFYFYVYKKILTNILEKNLYWIIFEDYIFTSWKI